MYFVITKNTEMFRITKSMMAGCKWQKNKQ
jgi:hypothetical protein